MSWLALAKLLLALAGHVAAILRDRQLMRAGAAEAIARTVEKQNARIDKALAARRAAGRRFDADPDAGDGFRRD